MSVLNVRDLSVPGRLANVSFALRAGTVTAVVGPNGAGKSTLLQAIAGLLPAGGEVEWGGRALPAISVLERARRLAWVPQEAQFHFAFSVREVVAQGRYMWNDDEAGVDGALDALDLRELSDRPVTRLSGGERHRVTLARALATGAKLQLWDEPLAQLDVRHALEVVSLARALASYGATLLVSLHDLRMAQCFDRVLLLRRGRLAGDGRPDEVLTAVAILDVFGVRARPAVSLELELP